MLATLSFPRTDTALLQWSQNIVNLITPTPATYGLVTADVTTYTALNTAYSAALAACDPSQRNKPAVVTKNAARDALKTGATLLANKIYASPTVTDAQKVQLGIPPRSNPTPIPVPISAPAIDIISVSGCTARIRLHDASGSGRGKAAGTSGASVFSFVGTTPPTDITAWKFEGNTGRVTKIDIAFPTTITAGATVWFTAFWFNGRKQSGPASTPISTNMPGGSVSMAA
jgi:hypothetical protein